MTFNYVSLSGTGTETLSTLSAQKHSKKVMRLLICNTDTTAITASLWLETGAGATKYILKNIEIESGYTLDVFDGIPFIYDDLYKLNISLGDAAYQADVIFNEIIP
tara:strand:- start:404 stop:721 length:318 start_codon:yes stop_codon:yes gene_type:complete